MTTDNLLVTFIGEECPVCYTMLPEHVRKEMLAALEIDPGVEPGYSYSRTLALDRVLARARLQYPQLFRR